MNNKIIDYYYCINALTYSLLNMFKDAFSHEDLIHIHTYVCVIKSPIIKRYVLSVKSILLDKCQKNIQFLYVDRTTKESHFFFKHF